MNRQDGPRKRTRLALALLATMTMLLTSACAGRTTVADTSCAAFQPIYLSDGAITALRPFRSDRLSIASHNAAWERLCR